jgi:DHA1 family bicyclomycin/chloramphenicol resistance-like MFS transporter
LAGTASGLIGASQMGAGALASILSAASENGSGIATGAWMLAGGLGAVGAVGLLRRRG